MNRHCTIYTVASLALAVSVATAQQPEKTFDSYERGRAHDMLHNTYEEVKKNYYDPSFHGLNLDARFHEYDAKLDQATSQGMAFRTIAAFLTGFKDSHLFFIPPPRPYRYDAGYRSQIIGDAEFVTHVRPGSDAAEKLTAGDRIVHLNGYNVNRQDTEDMHYFYRVLAPAPGVKLDISAPDGKQKEVAVKSRMEPRPRSVNLDTDDVMQVIRDEEGDANLDRDRVVEVGDTFVWKIYEFGDSPGQIDDVIKKARLHPSLILDLRGNPGGAIDTLKYLTAHLFDHDVKIFDEVSRKGFKSITARTAGSNAFTGKVIVLIDSGSASCSELLARVIQLEHRGQVIGDLSAGAVMESIRYPEQVGGDNFVVYALSITHANAVMSDGKSLEGIGVMPDERLLPTPDDLADGKDPILAHAIELLGGKSDPVATGKLFPFEWPKL